MSTWVRKDSRRGGGGMRNELSVVVESMLGSEWRERLNYHKSSSKFGVLGRTEPFS